MIYGINVHDSISDLRQQHVTLLVYINSLKVSASDISFFFFKKQNVDRTRKKRLSKLTSRFNVFLPPTCAIEMRELPIRKVSFWLRLPNSVTFGQPVLFLLSAVISSRLSFSFFFFFLIRFCYSLSVIFFPPCSYETCGQVTRLFFLLFVISTGCHCFEVLTKI